MTETTLDLGVQYGGSSMKIAFVRDETRSIIVNEDGNRFTPTITAINDTEFSIGLPAKQNMIRNAQNTILHAKHYMCNDLTRVHEIVTRKNRCEVKMNENNELVFSVERGEAPYELTLGEVVERQLQFLVDLAKSSLKAKQNNCVLSVPCYFTEAETSFLRTCAENVGFHVLRVIKNPVAACLAYDQEENVAETKSTLVYQLGGNSVEVSLVTLSNGLYRVVDSKHLKNVGGDKFTDLIVDILADEFKRKNRCDPRENKRSMSKLKSSAEDLKHILSTMERAHCTIDALFDGIDFDYYLNRQRFEGVCGRLYEQILAPIDEILAANGLTSVNQVILAGAATKMCKLQSLIMQKFENSRLLNTQAADEIIALGCAKECFLVSNSKHMKDLTDTDLTFKATSQPIFLVNGNSPDFLRICTANTPFPVRRNYDLTIDSSNPVLRLQESDDKVLAKINLKEFKTKAITFGINIKMLKNKKMNGNYNDSLRDMDWDDNVALPIANAENKLLEETISKKVVERNKFQSELSENSAKANALKDHIKNVKDELLSAQKLLEARRNELQTENHLKLIAEREKGRLWQENERLEDELERLKEKRNMHENEIFIANQQFDSMKAQMKWDQQALEAWLEESAQKDEDALTLKKYAKEDEGKIKDLTLRLEKLVDVAQKQKKLVDEETMNTITVQIELDKTAEEFRKTHRERQDLIKQWESIIDQMQKRDNQIERSAQSLMKMNIDLHIAQEDLEKKKSFFEDQQSINSKLERDIELLDQSISELSIRLTREETNRVQFQDELSGLKRTVERTGHDLERARHELSQMKKSINEKRNKILMLESVNKELVENLKETIEVTLSAEENAKRMEEFFLKARAKEGTLNTEIKKKSDSHFKALQELSTLRQKEKNYEAELNGCEANLKNMENRINRLDHDSLKQAEVIYTQDFNLQALERRVNRLQGEKNNDEQVELERRIAELKKAKAEKKDQYDMLLVQYKRVEDESRQSKRGIDELNKDKTYIDSKIAELTLHIDTAQRLLEKINVSKADLMVNENIKKLELKKLRAVLDKEADQVLDLNNEQMKLDTGMRERQSEITIHQDLLKAQLRSWNEELLTVSSELKERMAKVDKLKKRYDITMISMAPPDGTPAEESSQAYYVIKAAQEKEELQREGDELDAKIKKAERELRALENTLEVVNSNNETYKQSYSKAGDQSESMIQKEELEQQLRSLSDTYKHKRRQMKQLLEDVQNMEDAYNSMNNDEHNYEELIQDKFNKIVQAEKDIEQIKEKLERATKQILSYSRELRKSRGVQGATLEEKDFKLRDLWDFNKNKAKELVDISIQYPLLQQTLSILFGQANIPMTSGKGSTTNSSRTSRSGTSTTNDSSRTSRSSSRQSSVSGTSSANNSGRAPKAPSQQSGARAVNIGFDLPPSGPPSGKHSNASSARSSKR